VRRILPFVLVGLGVFLVAFAFVLRLFVYPSAAVTPYELGDPEKGTKGEQSVATGTVSVLDKGLVAKKGREAVRQDVPVRAIRTLVTDLKAKEAEKGGDVTVWRVGLAVMDDSAPPDETKLISDTTDQSVCLDRRTGESVDPCSDSHVVTCVKTPPKGEEDPCRLAQQGAAPQTPQTGLQYKFPFQTEQRDYQYYDTTILQATTAKYVGEEEMDGLTVYRFQQEIPETKISEDDFEAPGILFDPKLKKNVPAEQFYTADRTFWVEPETGQIVKGEDTSQQVLRGPDDTEELVVFDGTLSLIDEQVQNNVAEAKENRSKLRLVRLWAPLGAGVLGGLLIGAGLMLELGYRRRRRAAEYDSLGRHRT
jgi:hypothetical protein